MISCTVTYDPYMNDDIVTVRVPRGAERWKLPEYVEFHPDHGISLDYAGPWSGEIHELHPEGSAHQLLRFAFILACWEWSATPEPWMDYGPNRNP